MVCLLRTFMLCIVLAGCHHDKNETTAAPTAFNLTSIEPLTGAVKSFEFQWQESEFADAYTLCQKSVLALNECEANIGKYRSHFCYGSARANFE